MKIAFPSISISKFSRGHAPRPLKETRACSAQKAGSRLLSQWGTSTSKLIDSPVTDSLAIPNSLFVFMTAVNSQLNNCCFQFQDIDDLRLLGSNTELINTLENPLCTILRLKDKLNNLCKGNMPFPVVHTCTFTKIGYPSYELLT